MNVFKTKLLIGLVSLEWLHWHLTGVVEIVDHRPSDLKVTSLNYSRYNGIQIRCAGSVALYMEGF